MSHVSCLMCLVTCVLSHVSCHMCLVTCVLSHVSCHMCLVTCVLSHVSCHMCLVACVLSHLSCRMCLVTCVLSHVSCHICLAHVLQAWRASKLRILVGHDRPSIDNYTRKMVPITGRVRSFLLVFKNKIERWGRQNKNNRPINLPNVITFSTDFKYTTQS